MASNIVPDTIDDAYPVAGQDNDSQGFRDNFNIIKTNFTYAKSEIETLQDNTAKTNADNVFFENTLSRFTSLKQSLKHAAISVNGDFDPFPLSCGSAQHFELTVELDNRTVTITDWPTNDEYTEITMHCKGDGVNNWVLTFTGQYSTGLPSTMRVEDTTEFGGAAQIALSTTTTTTQVVKAFSYDNGETIYLQHMGTFIST